MYVKAYRKYSPKTVESHGYLMALYNSHYVAWRTNWEMAIVETSASVRSEPDWMEKLEDENAVQQWIDQLKRCQNIAQEHVDYFVAELRYYAKLQRANLGSEAKLSTVDMVWTMDISDDDTIARDFRQYVVDALEGVPTCDQDWTTIGDIEPKQKRCMFVHSQRPRLESNCKVLRLISPSLYTLLFDETPLLERPITSPLDALNLSSFGQIPGSHDAWKQAVHELNQRMTGDSGYIPINEDYLNKLDPRDRHWLPTDIHINDDGSVDFKSYINGLHPGKYPEAYKSIAKVIAKCLPALEQVLTDWKHPRDLRVPYSRSESVHETVPYPSDDSNFVYSDGAAYDDALDAWSNGIEYTIPIPDGFVEPKRPLKPNSLCSKDLQVIVKMESLYANPIGSNIPHEEWQCDGTASEQIIASIVYYYDVENVETIRMEFREGVTTSIIDVRSDKLAICHLYKDTLVHNCHIYYSQPAGSIPIEQGQAVCYPNVYQHCLPEICPADRSKPSHVKMLVLHFVDPSVHILSTSVIPPQQKEWWVDDVCATPRMRSLPCLVRNMILEYVDMPFSFNLAASDRKILDDNMITANEGYEDDYGNYISRFDVMCTEPNDGSYF